MNRYMKKNCSYRNSAMSILPGPEFRVPVEQHGLYGGAAWLTWVCKVIFTSNPTEAVPPTKKTDQNY